MENKKFGRWLVIKELESLKYNKNTKRVFLCKCECGNEKNVLLANLINGVTKSCGCLNSEKAKERMTTHGLSKIPEYFIYNSIKERCFNDKNWAYQYYGDKGILMCDSWKNSFEVFLKDMGRRPSELHSVDRIDSKKGYEPSNCRWATMKEQSRNKSSNVLITYNGRTQCLQDWCIELGLNRNSVKSRIKYGWTYERIFSTPIRKIKRFSS